MELMIFWTIFAGVVLFLFSIEHFSREMQRISGEAFKRFMRKVTSSPTKGSIAGFLVTALIQSSTATTVITVGLVNAGVLSFYNSLGIIFGSNLGSALTTQLIAFDLIAFGPIFIVLGFLISLFGEKSRLFGRAVFYFGLVFFSLNLISFYSADISSSPAFLSFFSNIDNLFLAIIFGALFTILLQSSGVVTGIVVIFVASGIFDFNQALGIILGANIGTTSTALFASIRMDLNARRAALAHFLYNLLGVLLILLFIVPFKSFIFIIGGSDAVMVANAHLFFNLFSLILFLIFVNPFYKMILKILPDKVI